VYDPTDCVCECACCRKKKGGSEWREIEIGSKGKRVSWTCLFILFHAGSELDCDLRYTAQCLLGGGVGVVMLCIDELYYMYTWVCFIHYLIGRTKKNTLSVIPTQRISSSTLRGSSSNGNIKCDDGSIYQWLGVRRWNVNFFFFFALHRSPSLYTTHTQWATVNTSTKKR